MSNRANFVHLVLKVSNLSCRAVFVMHLSDVDLQPVTIISNVLVLLKQTTLQTSEISKVKVNPELEPDIAHNM